jgi:hypothetical protein
MARAITSALVLLAKVHRRGKEEGWLVSGLQSRGQHQHQPINLVTQHQHCTLIPGSSVTYRQHSRKQRYPHDLCSYRGNARPDAACKHAKEVIYDQSGVALSCEDPEEKGRQAGNQCAEPGYVHTAESVAGEADQGSA